MIPGLSCCCAAGIFPAFGEARLWFYFTVQLMLFASQYFCA